MYSVFDIFKVGIGPSSSHTMGPMSAAADFIAELEQQHLFQADRIQVDLYGSLALTGKGHLTDVAVTMGLANFRPDTIDPEIIPDYLQQLSQTGTITLSIRAKNVTFRPRIEFHAENLPLHENGMRFSAYQQETLLYQNTFYSIGGGFVLDEAHFASSAATSAQVVLPYPFQSAKELLTHCKETGLSLSGLVMKNELAQHGQVEIDQYFSYIWQTMSDCIEKGLNTEGILPGPLRLVRRAPSLYMRLNTSNSLVADPMSIIDWVNLFAIAVNEQNAAGGRVVTAPTNGACGIVPAVLKYFDRFIQPLTQKLINRYFLASGVVGILYKSNASISGAEVGCQGEVGVACSMAAAGLAELLGGNPEQVCCAAEIGMEHNLGLTCDPVAGQVQVPCIERNAIAAVKAINAARMALERHSNPFVSLDDVIATMYATGKDMNQKYRETSLGGLAVVVRSCE